MPIQAVGRLAAVKGKFEPVLTGLAQGYMGNKYVSFWLFPVINNLTSRFLKIPFFGKELYKIYKARRATRGQSNRMPIDFRSTQSYELEEWDLYAEIDYAEIEEGRTLQDEKEWTTMRVQEAIALGIEAECADMAQNPANYPADHVLTLAGADQFTDSSSNPREAAKLAKETIKKKTGKIMNTLMIGSQTYNALEDHPALIEKIKYTQEGFIKLEHLKKYFGVQNVVIGESIYHDEVNNEMVDLWGRTMIFAYVDQTPQKQRNKKDLSFGRTFRLKSHPWVDSFETNPRKVLAIRNTDVVESVLVGPECGFLVDETVPAT